MNNLLQLFFSGFGGYTAGYYPDGVELWSQHGGTEPRDFLPGLFGWAIF